MALSYSAKYIKKYGIEIKINNPLIHEILKKQPENK